MRAVLWLAGAAAGLALASCGVEPQAAAEKRLRRVGPATLRAEAAALYKELFAAPPARYFVPRASLWPPAFQRFRPLDVRAYSDGFALSLRDDRGFEEGLYVVPLGMEITPRPGEFSRFQKIEDGIFWYRFSK